MYFFFFPYLQCYLCVYNCNICIKQGLSNISWTRYCWISAVKKTAFVILYPPLPFVIFVVVLFFYFRPHPAPPPLPPRIKRIWKSLFFWKDENSPLRMKRKKKSLATAPFVFFGGEEGGEEFKLVFFSAHGTPLMRTHTHNLRKNPEPVRLREGMVPIFFGGWPFHFVKIVLSFWISQTQKKKKQSLKRFFSLWMKKAKMIIFFHPWAHQNFPPHDDDHTHFFLKGGKKRYFVFFWGTVFEFCISFVCFFFKECHGELTVEIMCSW